MGKANEKTNVDNRREEIIKAAIKDTLGEGITIFTSEDVLIAANIDPSRIDDLVTMLETEMTRISKDSKKQSNH